MMSAEGIRDAYAFGRGSVGFAPAPTSSRSGSARRR